MAIPSSSNSPWIHHCHICGNCHQRLFFMGQLQLCFSHDCDDHDEADPDIGTEAALEQIPTGSRRSELIWNRER